MKTKEEIEKLAEKKYSEYQNGNVWLRAGYAEGYATAQDKWISVNDRLPERILLRRWFGVSKNYKITHWQLLELPKI